jgi:uncharacterized coiled-coil protein SlyX
MQQKDHQTESLHKVEEAIAALESWASECADHTAHELRGVITQKIMTLEHRLKRVRSLVETPNDPQQSNWN